MSPHRDEIRGFDVLSWLDNSSVENFQLKSKPAFKSMNVGSEC